jgi:hypothetical protein
LIGTGFVVSTIPGGLLTGCVNNRATKEESASEEKVIKPTSSDYFYVHNGNREMRWEAMADQGYYTPNWLFFVRNHTSTPRDIDVSSWRVGIANIKWVGSIEVSESPLYSDWNTNNYVMIGDAYPNHPVLTTQNPKSAFELPWDGQIEAGRRQLTGRSWSGDAEIEQVEVSMDGGSTWQGAELANPNIWKAWAQWLIDWDAQPGRYGLQARATDRDGNTQPSSVPFNEKGYLYNAVVEHPITVA